MHDNLLGGIGDAARVERVLESALRVGVKLAHGPLLFLFIGRWRATRRHFSIGRLMPRTAFFP